MKINSFTELEKVLSDIVERLEKLENNGNQLFRFTPITLSGTGTSTVSSAHKCESDDMVYLSNPTQWKCKHCGKFYTNREEYGTIS